MRSRAMMFLAGGGMAALVGEILASEHAIGGPVIFVRDEPPDDYHARRLAEDQARSERVARATAREEAEIAYGRAMIEAAEAKRARKNARRLRNAR